MSLPATPALSPDDKHIQRLGHAGLIPFVLLAATVWLVEPELQPWAAIAMAGYAGLIVSFLGGIHWGLAFQRQAQHMQALVRTHLVWGVLASLLAWPGMLMPAHAGLVWLALALIACYLVDRRLYLAAGVGRWLTLRFRLSAVAALSCLLAAGAV
jgi:hypothetical protein